METLTVIEAFESMRSFVRQFAEREPAEHRDRFEALLRWTERESDGMTVDPAPWDDWLRSIGDATARLRSGRP
jgi:hypothetical protein